MGGLLSLFILLYFAMVNFLDGLARKCLLRRYPGARFSKVPIINGSYVGAARKVSPNWSLETMTCHSSHCFSIVWGLGNEPLVTSLPSSLLHDINGPGKLLPFTLKMEVSKVLHLTL